MPTLHKNVALVGEMASIVFLHMEIVGESHTTIKTDNESEAINGLKKKMIENEIFLKSYFICKIMALNLMLLNL